MLILPSFAVGRTQELLYVPRALEEAGALPSLDVFVNSPMALDATAMTLTHLVETVTLSLRGAEAARPLAAPGA